MIENELRIREFAIRELLTYLRPIWRERGKHIRTRYYLQRNSFIEGADMAATLTTEQQVTVAILPTTLAGNPAEIDGDVVWTSSDEAVATVVSTGQMTALIKAVGKGASQITATFDADLDDTEVRTIQKSDAVNVVAAEAEGAEFVFGTPELNPDLNAAVVAGQGSVTPNA